jgi:hypothetical protein
MHGVVLRLRPDPALEGAPGLPGILRERPGDRPDAQTLEPVVKIMGGRIELERWGLLGEDVTLRLDCRHLEAESDHGIWRLTAEFGGQRVESMILDLVLDPKEGTFESHMRVEGLSWSPEDLDLLARRYRRRLPPLEMSGVADVELDAEGRLGNLRDADHLGKVVIRGLGGRFGNLHTGDRAGMPFTLEDGTCTARVENGRLLIPDLDAVFVSPAGKKGKFGLELALDLLDPTGDVDFTLKGEGVRATTDDLRLLLQQEVVNSIVDPFRPAGTLDFRVHVLQREGHPEKVWADLEMRDGTFNYAGRLDELTGKRFGFHYPLERCSGRIHVETNIPSPRGLTEVSIVENLRGFKPIRSPRPGGPRDVTVIASGKVVGYRAYNNPRREDVDLRIGVEDLPIDSRLAAAFASTPGGVPYSEFDLKGWADTVDIRIEREGFGDNEPRSSYVVRLKDCEAAYKNFPVPLHNLHGTVVSTDERPDEEGVRWREIRIEKLEGDIHDGGKLVVEDGSIRQSDRGKETRKIRAKATDVLLGEAVHRALEQAPGVGEGVLELWTMLRPTGKVDATISMLSHDQVRVDIELAGKASLRGYRDIDCPVTDLRGRITHSTNHVDLTDIEGDFGGSKLHLEGYVDEDGVFDLKSNLKALTLDEPVLKLVRSLSPETGPVLDALQLGPDSMVDVVIHTRRRAPGRDIEVDGYIDSARLRTVLRGVPVEIRGGPVRMNAEEIVIESLWLEAEGAQVHILGASLPRGEGRHGHVVLDGTNLHPIRHLKPFLSDAFEQVLGDNVRVDLKSFRVEFNRHDRTIICSGAVDLRLKEVREDKPDVLQPTGALGFSPLTLRLPDSPDEPLRFSGVIEYRGLNMNMPLDLRDMSGQLMVADGELSDEFSFRGAIFKGAVTVLDRRIEEISTNITYEPNYLSLENIDARFYVGKFNGGIHIHLADPGAFKVNVKATGVDLGKMLEEDMPHDEEVTGLLDAAIGLESRSGELRHMTGQGSIQVREGQLFRLPTLRTILAVLGRVAPLGFEATSFKNAEVRFDIDGETFRVHRLHLSTKMNDIYCRGTVSLYGDLDLDVKPQVTKMIDLPRLINIPVLSSLRNLWHRTVYEIRMEGTIDSPTLSLRALPFLKREHTPFIQSAHAGHVLRMRPSILD